MTTISVNAAGNFYTKTKFAAPFKAKVMVGTNELVMKDTITDGSCNSCHTEFGLKKAPEGASRLPEFEGTMFRFLGTSGLAIALYLLTGCAHVVARRVRQARALLNVYGTPLQSVRRASLRDSGRGDRGQWRCRERLRL